MGHELGRGLGRQGGPRRTRLDGRVPHPAQPAPLRRRGGAGLGPARLALDRPQSGGGAVATHPAQEQRPDVPPRRTARHPRPQALAPRRAPATRRRLARTRQRPGDPDADHAGSTGLDAKIGLASRHHARRHGQPRLRPGRGRPLGDEPVGLRDLLRGEAALLPRGPEDPELRQRGERSAVLLAPLGHAPSYTPLVPDGERSTPRPARRFSARSRSRARRARSLARRPAEPDTGRDGPPHGGPRADASRRSSLPAATSWPAPQGLGQGQHEPGRHADADAPLRLGAAARLPPEQRADGRDRLRPLLRQPLLAAGGQRHRLPHHRGAGGDPRPARPARSTTTSAPTRTTSACVPRPRPSRDMAGRSVSAARARVASSSPTTCTGTRRAWTSTTSATCARPT